jgi:uncharacterized protein YcfL
MSAMQNHTQRLCLIVLVLLALVGPACSSKQPSSTANTQPSIANTNSPSQTNTSSAPKLDEKPAFVGLIKNVSIYPVPGQQENLAISLVVAVKNAGGG